MLAADAIARIALAVLVTAARAAVPPCASLGTGYKSTLLTVNGGFPADASECQAACQAKVDCTVFTYYSLSQACWLQGPEAISGKDADDAVSGPKVCPGFNETAAFAPETAPVAPVTAPVASAVEEPASLQQVTIAPGIAAIRAGNVFFNSENETAPAGESEGLEAAGQTIDNADVMPKSLGASAGLEGPTPMKAASPYYEQDQAGLPLGWALAGGIVALIVGGVVAFFCVSGPKGKKKKVVRSLHGKQFEATPGDVEADAVVDPISVAPLLPMDFSPLTTQLTAQDAPLVLSLNQSTSQWSSAARSVTLPPAPAMPMRPLTFQQSPALPSTCASCGNVFAADARFCRRCGARRGA